VVSFTIWVSLRPKNYSVPYTLLNSVLDSDQWQQPTHILMMLVELLYMSMPDPYSQYSAY